MTPRKQERITFFSPGLFFAETATRDIPGRDTALAAHDKF